MRRLYTAIGLTLLALALISLTIPTPCYAQATYAGGISFAPGADQRFAGTALATKPLNDSGTQAFTIFDAVPTNYHPVKIASNVGVGVEQRILTLDILKHTVPIYIPTSAGVSWTGTSVGWNWNGGVRADISVKGPWGISPHLRFLKSSVNENSDYQVILGFLIRYRVE